MRQLFLALLTIALTGPVFAAPISQLPATINPSRDAGKLYLLNDPNGNLVGASEHLVTVGELLEEATSGDVGLGLVENIKHAYNMVVAPTASADSSISYAAGKSTWTMADGTSYVCTGDTPGAATWVKRNIYTDADKTKLSGIATGATANATDAQLRDRSTHTGVQPAGSITQDADNRFVTDAQIATFPTADQKAAFPAGASAEIPLVLTTDARFDSTSTWYGIRESDPDPLPVSGAWIRRVSKQLVFSDEGAVQFVGLSPGTISLPTFPGAVGYGTSTTGGIDRAGTTTIYEVTTLADSGAGSLRPCLEATGYRVCVFEISGQIQLSSDLVITNGNLTIAGETAPFPGITIAGAELRIDSASDIVIRHIKSRPGDSAGALNDGLMVVGTSSNIVIDHCSFTWSQDEQVATWGMGGLISDISITNSIIGEGIGSQRHGVLIGPFTERISLIGNLLANNNARNPFFQDAGSHLFANNFIYNPGPYEMSNITVSDGSPDGPSYSTIISNRWKAGPLTTAYVTLAVSPLVSPGTKFYANDNSSPLAFYTGSSSYVASVANPWLDGLSLMGSASVEASVLANAGAFSGNRDVIDARIISEATGGTTGKHATCVQQTATAACDQAAEYLYTTGNVPTVAVNSRSLTPGEVIPGTAITWPASPNTLQASGYNELEEALHALASLIQE